MKKYLILLAAIILSGCGSNTSIVSSWRDPKITVAQEHFKKVLVVVLVKDEASRRTAENRIAASNEIVNNESNDKSNKAKFSDAINSCSNSRTIGFIHNQNDNNKHNYYSSIIKALDDQAALLFVFLLQGTLQPTAGRGFVAIR